MDMMVRLCWHYVYDKELGCGRDTALLIQRDMRLKNEYLMPVVQKNLLAAYNSKLSWQNMLRGAFDGDQVLGCALRT